jgi:hypothetical protein
MTTAYSGYGIPTPDSTDLNRTAPRIRYKHNIYLIKLRLKTNILIRPRSFFKKIISKSLGGKIICLTSHETFDRLIFCHDHHNCFFLSISRDQCLLTKVEKKLDVNFNFSSRFISICEKKCIQLSFNLVLLKMFLQQKKIK